MGSEAHTIMLMEMLEKFRKSKQYTDLRVIATDGETNVHRVLISSLCTHGVKVKPSTTKRSDTEATPCSIKVNASLNNVDQYLRLVYSPSSIKSGEYNQKQIADIAIQFGVPWFMRKTGTTNNLVNYAEVFKLRNTALGQTLSTLKRSKHLSDITLIVDNQKFFCHKIIMSSFSAFFDAMFTSELKEYHQDEIQIHDVDKYIFMSILDFMYTGENIVNINNVQKLLSTSSYLQIPQLQCHCERFICRHIEIDNCVDVAILGDAVNSEYLLSKAVSFISRHFSELVLRDRINSITKNIFISILREKHINTENEYSLFQTVLSWLRQNKDVKPLEVLKNVNLSQILDEELEDALSDSLMIKNEECSEYIKETMKSKSNREEQRRCFGSEEVMLVMWSSSYKQGLHLACYSFKSLCWYHLPGMPKHASGGSYASCSDAYNIYMCGGYANTTAFYRFNLLQFEWEKLGPIDYKYGRADHAMVMKSDVIYLIGGSQDRIVVMPHVDKYNVNDRSWNRVGALSIAVSNPSCAIFGNSILIFGGNKSFGEFVTSIQRFDLSNGSCTVFSKLPVMCSFSGLVVNEDEAYIVGPKGDVMIYEFGKEPVVIGSVHKQSMFGFGVLYYQGKVFVIGGNSDRAESTETRAFDVISRKPCITHKNMKVPAKKESNQYHATIIDIRSSMLTLENVHKP